MTITGGSALPKEDIDRMMREAEQFADEDKKRREAAETRNQAETLVYSTEKFLSDNGDKVPEDVKSEVTAATGDLKKALEADDLDAIKRSTETLATVSQKMGQAMYAATGEQPGAATDGGPTTNSDDEVVDAEIVDEGGTTE
jgi:molecular chaperone DnaK